MLQALCSVQTTAFCILTFCLCGGRRRFRHLLSDSLVALSVVVMHGTIIMCQGMAYSVAMNSKRSSALVALLIATNFVEIKGKLQTRPLLREMPMRTHCYSCCDTSSCCMMVLRCLLLLSNKQCEACLEHIWYTRRPQTSVRYCTIRQASSLSSAPAH